MRTIAAAFLLLQAAQNVPPNPLDYGPTAHREGQIAWFERWTGPGVSPTTRRVLATMTADLYAQTRPVTERRFLLEQEREQAALASPFDERRFLAALAALDAFERAHPDPRPAALIAAFPRIPAGERAAVARFVYGRTARDTAGAMSLDPPEQD